MTKPISYSVTKTGTGETPFRLHIGAITYAVTAAQARHLRHSIEEAMGDETRPPDALADVWRSLQSCQGDLRTVVERMTAMLDALPALQGFVKADTPAPVLPAVPAPQPAPEPQPEPAFDRKAAISEAARIARGIGWKLPQWALFIKNALELEEYYDNCLEHANEAQMGVVLGRLREMAKVNGRAMGGNIDPTQVYRA